VHPAITPVAVILRVTRNLALEKATHAALNI
jgi:hypothetical protein